jgi:NAD-dependent oxidoreductase involved in siderophore biosynthesis
VTIFLVFFALKWTSRRDALRAFDRKPRIRAMSLNAQQKSALAFQLAELLEHDEPNAFLVTLQRIAEREAFNEARRNLDYHQALRWQTIAEAVARVRLELLASQISSATV